MIILGTPKYEVFTCERCGTIFRPEASDNLLYLFSPSLDSEYEIYINCPTCDSCCKIHELNFKKEKTYNED